MTTSHKLVHVLILDKSSSMRTVRDVTIQGFNENLKGMREDKPDAAIEQEVCLVTFSDDVREGIWLKPIAELTDLTVENYSPSGNTALYDAIGKTITRLETEIGDQIKAKDVNVIVTIFTDGEENASKEWKDFNKLKGLMDSLRQSNMWTFSFIGCEENSIKTAQRLGIATSNVMNFAPTAEGTSEAFSQLRRSRSAYTSKISASVANFKGASAALYDQSMADNQVDFFADDKDDDKKPKA